MAESAPSPGKARFLRNWPGHGLVILALLLIGAFYFYYPLIYPKAVEQNITQAQLLELVKEGRVTSIVSEPEPYSGLRIWTGTFKEPANSVSGAPGSRVAFQLALNRGAPQFEAQIRQAGYNAPIPSVSHPNVLVPMIVYGLIILGAAGGLLFIVLPLTSTVQRLKNGPPPSISLDSARRHMVLVCLIRATEALVVAPLALLVLLMGCGFILQINPFRTGHLYNGIFSTFMLITFLLVGAVMIARGRHHFSKSWQEMSQEFQKVNANSVSNFAFIFSAFAAHDFYHLAPFNLYLPFSGGKVIHVSPDMWPLVFLILWPLTKSVVLRLLELNPPNPPQEPPSEADEPFVSFDPMNPFAPKSIYRPPQNQN